MTLRPRLLVVDDEEDIRVLLGHLFRTGLPGVGIDSAASGAEALRSLARAPCDVILSDFRMDGMDGVAFLTASQQAAPRALRILMTAFPELEVPAADLNAARLHAVLAKPFEPDEILAVVQAALATATKTGPASASRPAAAAWAR